MKFFFSTLTPGEILQLYEMVVKELTDNPSLLELRLNTVMDTSTTLDKLQVTQRICPDIQKLDISMFNFSFAEEDFVLGAQRGRFMSYLYNNLKQFNQFKAS